MVVPRLGRRISFVSSIFGRVFLKQGCERERERESLRQRNPFCFRGGPPGQPQKLDAALDIVAKPSHCGRQHAHRCSRGAGSHLGIDAIPAALWYSCPTARHAALLATLWHRARQRHHEHMCRSVPLDTEGLREQWQRSREGLFAAAHHLSKARWNLSYVLQAVRRLRHGQKRLQSAMADGSAQTNFFGTSPRRGNRLTA